MRNLPRLTAFLLSFLVAVSLRAQEPLELPRVTGPIVLDGVIDEPAWLAIEPLPAVIHSPTFGAPPTERTELRVAYDDEYLYASCHAWDSDADGIRSMSLRRDDGAFSNDRCTLGLDTFNDNENTLLFGTTPAGLRFDAAISGDGTPPPNLSWNAFWDAAVSRDAESWQAEIRVPLSSLRFQPDAEGRVVMGLGLIRYIARKNEMITFPAISPRWGFFSFVKASQFRDVVLRDVAASTPLYVTPYVLGGSERSPVLNAEGTSYANATEGVRDAGLDLKYGVAANVTLDLTVNTDFAQVEADDQQVNLTRFSLFFPEKRLFFQERASIFDYGLGGNERLFHSRRVGLIAGEPVRIYGGARFVGRLGDWDVGLLDMHADGATPGITENLGVARLRRRVFNENSYIGGILTSRLGEAGTGHNIVYGADALLRVFGQDYVTVDLAQSFDDADPVDATVPDRTLARLFWERRVEDGLAYALDISRVGPTFEPELGFLFRRDYTKAGAGLGYGWRPGEASPLLRHRLTVDGTVFRRNADGSTETVEVQPQYVIELKSGHQLTGRLTGSYDDLERSFRLSDDAAVPAGRHRFTAARLSYRPPNGSLFGVTGSLEGGGFYDGRMAAVSLTPEWNASRHLELSGTYSFNTVRFPQRDERFAAHIARLRALVMLDTRVSAVAFVQYSSAADRMSANVRVRYNPSEGHDLYVVWNEGLHTARHALDPAPPLSERRTLLVKYSRTFTFGL